MQNVKNQMRNPLINSKYQYHILDDSPLSIGLLCSSKIPSLMNVNFI